MDRSHGNTSCQEGYLRFSANARLIPIWAFATSEKVLPHSTASRIQASVSKSASRGNARPFGVFLAIANHSRLNSTNARSAMVGVSTSVGMSSCPEVFRSCSSQFMNYLLRYFLRLGGRALRRAPLLNADDDFVFGGLVPVFRQIVPPHFRD